MSQNGNGRDKSIASLTGTSQKACDQNGSRQFLEISNTGNADAAFNYMGGTASLTGTGCVILASKSSRVYDRWVPQGQVNVIGTTGQTLTVIEG